MKKNRVMLVTAIVWKGKVALKWSFPKWEEVP